MQNAPVCYSCIKYAQIILVPQSNRWNCKTALNNWVTAICSTCFQCGIMKDSFSSCLWSWKNPRGDHLLGLFALLLIDFWRLKPEWKYRLESPPYWEILFLSEDVHGKHIVSLSGSRAGAVRMVLVSPGDVVMGDVTLFLQVQQTIEAKRLSCKALNTRKSS